MFRSGTTLITKALGAHRDVVTVADPFFQMFKGFRNCITKNIDGLKQDFERPIDDYFCSSYFGELKSIYNSNFSIPLSGKELKDLINSMKPYVKFYFPELERDLNDLQAKTYRDLIINLLDMTYSKIGDEEKFIGFKNTFCEVFSFPLMNSDLKVKTLFIIRDPRAMLASQNKAKGSSYPILFALRHWRKSYACAIKSKIEHPNMCYLLKYEDFIMNPEKHSRLVCDFLGFKYDSGMIEFNNYSNNDGSQWNQNSSYGTASKINSEFIERWRTELDSEQIKLVENSCSPEMKALGYLSSSYESSSLTFPKFDIEVQDWIKPYIKRYELNGMNLEKETQRLNLLKQPLANITKEERQKFFLFDDDSFILNAFQLQSEER